MADWTVTYNGWQEVSGLDIQPDEKLPNLKEHILAGAKQIRKGHHRKDHLTMKVEQGCLKGMDGNVARYLLLSQRPLVDVFFLLVHPRLP